MFCNDIIGPLVKRVLRKLGIREQIGRETIIDETQNDVPFEVDAELGHGQYFGEGLTGSVFENIASGDAIDVLLDGVRYSCTANRDGTEINIGNVEGTPDGLPFLFRFDYTGETWDVVIFVMNLAPTHRFALYTQTETITPIDPKYLPIYKGEVE